MPSRSCATTTDKRSHTRAQCRYSCSKAADGTIGICEAIQRHTASFHQHTVSPQRRSTYRSPQVSHFLQRSTKHRKIVRCVRNRLLAHPRRCRLQCTCITVTKRQHARKPLAHHNVHFLRRREKRLRRFRNTRRSLRWRPQFPATRHKDIIRHGVAIR